MAQKKQAAWKGFAQGSLGAAVGGAAAHPLDLIKVRMQLQGQGAEANAPKLNMVQMGAHIKKTQGIGGFYKGVDASIARQLVYSGVRFGVYDVLKTATSDYQDGVLGVVVRVGCAAAAGAIGAFAGNPGDLAMVRMQADGKLPPDQRRNYKNIFDAAARISRDEGVTSLWRTGLIPNANRAMIVTVGQLAAYDQCKALLQSFGARNGLPTHFSASFMAAFIASAMSNPVDVAKTRLMNQKAGEVLYTGTLNCLTSIVRTEGPLALYKGFAATYARQCPYVVVTFVTVEQLKKIMKDW
jgi:solute carrier family 25 oxoglutarate transporter 11